MKSKHRKYLKAVLIGTGIVSFWRGVWGLSDLYILPENPTLSFIISAVLGLLILAITHSWLKLE